jgi:hypothetical protein
MQTSTNTVSLNGFQGYTRDSTFTYLSGLVTPQEYAEYDRVVSQLYLNTIAQGNFSFSESDSTTLFNIASLCPALGGSAVYMARSMYAFVHPFARFDNYSICNAQGMQYRIAQQTEPVKPTESMLIYPNPNSGQLNISWSEISENVNYTLLNSLGQIMKQWNSTDVLQSLDLGKTGISNGIYFIKAQSENGKMHHQKFIYQR